MTDTREWQDISSAPKDGTQILVFTQWAGDEIFSEPFDSVQIAYWDEGNLTDDYWHRDAGWELEKIGEPTHWMPLPPAPQEKG